MIDSPSLSRNVEKVRLWGKLRLVALVLGDLDLELDTEALYLAAAADLTWPCSLYFDIHIRCSSLLISTSTSNNGWRDTQ
jgi:hypothetical protein